MTENYDVKQARFEEILSKTQRDVKETKLAVHHIGQTLQRLEQAMVANTLLEKQTRDLVQDIDSRVTSLEKDTNFAKGAIWLISGCFGVVMMLVVWLFNTVSETSKTAMANKLTIEAYTRYPQDAKQ